MKEDKTYCVYLHRNITNGKVYIGQTKNQDNPVRRWGSQGQGYKNSPIFYAAIQKYGWDNFEHEILERDLTSEEADEKEAYYIALYQSNLIEYGYNYESGRKIGPQEYPEERRKEMGEKRQKYLMEHPEVIQKISDSMKEKWKDEEYRAKVLNRNMPKGEEHYNYGKHLSAETKQKIAAAHKGKKLSDEHIEKVKEHNYKPIKNTNTGEIFQNAEEAALSIGRTDKTAIRQIRVCCRGEQKTAYGFHWIYITKEEEAASKNEENK